MEEKLIQRKAELELAAKNTIVEIYLIKTNVSEITKNLTMNEHRLENINASLREIVHLDYIDQQIAETLAAKEKEALAAKEASDKNRIKDRDALSEK